MDTDTTMSLIYLSLLGGVIAGSFILSNRGQMGKMAQQAAIWALIFLGAIAVFGLWDDISQSVIPRQAVTADGQITAPLRADGHYALTAEVNGTPVEFIVDTGASQIVLSQEDARRIGLDPAALSYLGRASTANGEVRTAPVRLDSFALGPHLDRNFPAVVNQAPMDGSLLGMSYLSQFSSVEIRGQELILTR